MTTHSSGVPRAAVTQSMASGLVDWSRRWSAVIRLADLVEAPGRLEVLEILLERRERLGRRADVDLRQRLEKLAHRVTAVAAIAQCREEQPRRHEEKPEHLQRRELHLMGPLRRLHPPPPEDDRVTDSSDQCVPQKRRQATESAREERHERRQSDAHPAAVGAGFGDFRPGRVGREQRRVYRDAQVREHGVSPPQEGDDEERDAEPADRSSVHAG